MIRCALKYPKCKGNADVLFSCGKLRREPACSPCGVEFQKRWPHMMDTMRLHEIEES